MAISFTHLNKKCAECKKNWAIPSEELCAYCSPTATTLKVCRFCKHSLNLEKFAPNRDFCSECSDRFHNYGERVCENCEARFFQEDFKTVRSVEKLCASCEKQSERRFKLWMIFLVPLILYGLWSSLTESDYGGLPDPSIDRIQVRP